MKTRIGAIGTVAVLLAACSATLEPSPSVDRPSAPPSASEVSEPVSPGGSISLDSLSGRIVFDNYDEVWTIEADGTNLQQLTSAPGHQFDPSWSPDGTRIAYRSDDGVTSEIWLMNADGSGQRKLTDGFSPAWSPDGSLIAFAGPKGTTGIITLIRPDGTGLRQLPHTEGGEYPSWSPDGTQIAFNSNLSGDHVMYIVQADGSTVVDLSAVGEGWQVDWSPDGSLILFTSHRDHPDNYTDVYVMRTDGSDIRRLTDLRAYTAAWSPDGEHIVFSAPGLFVMNADGTGATPLRTNVGETSLADWTQ
jgi:Tol biopolymer transport system component